MCVHMHAWCPLKPEEGRVVDPLELKLCHSIGYWELNPTGRGVPSAPFFVFFFPSKLFLQPPPFFLLFLNFILIFVQYILFTFLALSKSLRFSPPNFIFFLIVCTLNNKISKYGGGAQPYSQHSGGRQIS